VLGRLARFVRGLHTPALELVAAQQGDAFSVLVGTVLSLRTRDETTLPAFRRLHAIAPTPAALAAADETDVAAAIRPVAFHRTKARQLRELAALLLRDHGGTVPADPDALLALPGVGRKTANLTLALGHGRPAVCVDVHVHRICNRLGALRTRTPEQTEQALCAALPRRWWARVNPTLVPFGQALCTPTSPHCSRCPVADACARVDVGRSR